MVPRELGMWIVRIILIVWLGLSQKSNDDLYGVLTSIRRFNECFKLVHLTED